MVAINVPGSTSDDHTLTTLKYLTEAGAFNRSELMFPKGMPDGMLTGGGLSLNRTGGLAGTPPSCSTVGLAPANHVTMVVVMVGREL